MLQFNESSLIVPMADIQKGACLVFGQSKDSSEQSIYTSFISVFVPNDKLVATRSDWNGWHNFGKKVESLDESYLVNTEIDSLIFNRAYMFAPYGGVSISGNYFKCKAWTRIHDLHNSAKEDFIITNEQTKSFSLLLLNDTTIIYKKN